jgi:Mrp family chromosome partitioning ATPase/predicted Fe-Mo cluster-binding NifX family protein
VAEEKQSCGVSHSEKHDQQDLEIRDRLGKIKHKLLVMSGKGGVGKSSVAAYLAFALAKKGYQVGLMDVDLHGPSIPRLLGLKEGIQPSPTPGKARPVKLMPNLEVISIESLMGEDKDAATIWRGPIKIGVIRQFISDIEWSPLDYLIIDSPPGTGDEPLTVAQTIPDSQAVIVTTPQEISLADVRKSISFCRRVDMKILGIVENMSGLYCPHCNERIDLFKSKGGQKVAKQEGLPLLANLPIEPEVVRQGDIGGLEALIKEDLPFTNEFNRLVQQVEHRTDMKETKPEIEKKDEKESDMEKIVLAIPVADGKLCAHFGHCDQFALIETENGQIKGTSMHTPPPHEPGVLPKWLNEMGANVIIAGGMGARAQSLFDQNGIKVVTGAPSDSPQSLAALYLNQKLVTGENICDH